MKEIIRIKSISQVHDFYGLEKPKHPYTKGLLSSIPKMTHPPKTDLQTIEGMVPDLKSLPSGCRFQNRCPFVDESCMKNTIELQIEGESLVRCHKWKEV